MKIFSKPVLGVTSAAIIAVSGFVFSQSSLNHLNPVCPQLVEVTTLALQLTPTDFGVIDGWRTTQEHQLNVMSGKSWIGRSKHQDGVAIDIIAVVNGQRTWAKGQEEQVYRPIVNAFKQAAEMTGNPIIAGADWRVRDYSHIELVKPCVWPLVVKGAATE